MKHNPNLEWWQALGALLGYPECCIEDFCNRDTLPTERRPFDGTGFIPCPKCAAEARAIGLTEWLARNIAPNRKVATEFPMLRKDDPAYVELHKQFTERELLKVFG